MLVFGDSVDGGAWTGRCSSYQRFCIMAISRRSPAHSLNQVRRSRLQIATHWEGMTRRLVWNCASVVRCLFKVVAYRYGRVITYRRETQVT
jgi:hypothetical protein